MSSDLTALEEQVATYMQQQRWDDALETLRQLIEAEPDRLNYTARLAHLVDGLGHTHHAIDVYRRFLDRNPADATAHFNVAGLYKKMQQDDLALAALDEAIRLEIDHAEEVHLNKGVLFAETHRPEEAKKSYEKSLSIEPDYVPALFNLAGLLEEEGERQRAIEIYNRLLELQPDNWDALSRLVYAEKVGPDHAGLVERIEKAVAETTADALAQQTLNFALGKARDDLQEFTQATAAYTAANAAARTHAVPYDRKQTEQAFDQLIEVYDPEWIANTSTESDAEPIFINGMFRSGSTLLEHRLAGHPAIVAGGELDVLPWLIGRNLAPYPQGVRAASMERLREMAAYYQSRVQSFFPGAQRVTDKRPTNFMDLGLIKVLFPKARIIHTTRHIADNCLSVFFQQMGPGFGYATDLGDVAHYYGQQERLKEHWQTCFGDDLHTVRYEELITEPQTVLRGVLDYLGLEWDDGLLESEQDGTRVRTASIWQVRQDLHTRSKGRWANYESLVKAVPELAEATGKS
ncbi:MAG: sulfotransferase [Gammaproteobacteria bacterium]|nr:sulfotransferase [Gammaproteobacteria bacterium]